MIITCSIFQFSHQFMPLQCLPVFLRCGSSTGFLFSLTDEAGSITQWSGHSNPGTDIWSLEFETPPFLEAHALFPSIRVVVKTHQSSHHHVQIVFHEEGYHITQKGSPIASPGRLTYEDLPSPFCSPQDGVPDEQKEITRARTPAQTISDPYHALHGNHFDSAGDASHGPKYCAKEMCDMVANDRPAKRPRVDDAPRRSRRLMEKHGAYIHLSE